MASPESALIARARRAYERGRVLLGLRRAGIAVPMGLLSLYCCGRPTATCIAAGLLAATIVFFEWRGEALGRGARLGVWIGLPPLLLPIAVAATGHMCGASFCALYPGCCLAGGIAAGAALGWWGVHRGLDVRVGAAAAVVAALVGSLGCLIAGITGLAGLVVGLALGATPMVTLRRA